MFMVNRSSEDPIYDEARPSYDSNTPFEFQMEALWLLEDDPKGGKITGKGKIKTANLDFDDVYFVDELKQVVLRAPRKDDVYSLDLKNIVPSGGKFDGKSDEGYLLGYSTSSKAFKVYNKRTKRVEENLHINFLEDQPNVARTGTQDSYVAGSSGKDKGPTHEYILLLLQPHRTRILVKDVVQDAQEQPSENASPRRIAAQKKAAQATSTNQLSTDRSFVSTDRSNTPNVSAASTSTGANADKSSFVYLGGKIPIDASTLSNDDLPIDPNMPDKYIFF
ncbi:hypothetical protein Tco_0772103 [Tanacetum coccineum]|uniref:Retroviral polymerase SH3-like domain-containing protein n=1 Tax=Tanacetum coccineum TaxID=301880 RepID=A0ABQ4ZJW6_9ASTR